LRVSRILEQHLQKLVLLEYFIFFQTPLFNNLAVSIMAKDDPSIPAWQRVTAGNSTADQDAPKPSPSPSQTQHDLAGAEAIAEQMPDFGGREVDELAPIPTREEAARFLDHPGTKNAAVDDKIRFLEVKGVREEDIEALIPEAKTIYAAVSGEL
jgi:hypothetical protein